MWTNTRRRRVACGSPLSTETAVPWLAMCLASVLVVAGPTPALPGSCTVPSTGYPTVQTALDDPQCDPVLLNAGTFVGSLVIDRSVTVEGQSSATSIIEGQVTVSAGPVVLNALTITTDTALQRGRFQHALEAAAGAHVSGVDLVVVHRALLFGDGFESGTTAGWSATTP